MRPLSRYGDKSSKAAVCHSIPINRFHDGALLGVPFKAQHSESLHIIQPTKDLIRAQKMSHGHNNKDLSCLR